MSDLVAFLRARLDEDEQTARETVIVSRVAHIARHDPARVLAEVAAKRRIVELHDAGGPHECPEWKWRDPDHPEDPHERKTGYASECLTLRLLALSFSDDPDYDESWRP